MKTVPCKKCGSPHVTERDWGGRRYFTCKVCGKTWDEAIELGE